MEFDARSITDLGSHFSPEIARILRILEQSVNLALQFQDPLVNQPHVKLEGGDWDLVGNADIYVQSFILNQLSPTLPDNCKTNCFIVEETAGMEQFSNLLFKGSEQELKNIRRLYVIDPIDGSEEHSAECAEWCIQAGIIRRGELWGSVIIIPAINGGIVCVSEIGNGCKFFEWNRAPIKTGRIKELDTVWAQTHIVNQHLSAGRARMPFVRHGVSLQIERVYGDLLFGFSSKSAPKSIVSCGVGLAYVACGKIHAFVHRPLPIYDWAPGVTAVLASGGEVIYYEMREGKPHRLEKPNLLGETGIFCGHREVIKWLWKIFVTDHEKMASHA